MNYLKQLNAFHDWLETNQLNAVTQALWFHLMAIANKGNWPEWFAVANLQLQVKLEVNKATLIKHRNILIQKGRIEYRNQGRKAAGMYKLIPFDISSKNEPINPDISSNNEPINPDISSNNEPKDAIGSRIGSKNEPKCELNGVIGSRIGSNFEPSYKLNNDLKTKQNITPLTPLNSESTTNDDQCSSLTASLSAKKKIKFADFVSMTNDEHSSLVEKLGSEARVKRCIEILDNYKGASGKTYKSDFRAILSWVITRLEEEERKSGQAAPDQGNNDKKKAFIRTLYL